MLMQSRMKSLINFLAACLLAGFLAACGGGGTNDGCVNIDPNRSGALPGCSGSGGTTSPGTGTSTSSSMTILLQDVNGAAITNLMPDSPGILKVTVKTSNGTVVPDAVVVFTSTDSTAVFSPSAGTALTGADGVATIKLAAGTQAGAFTVTAATIVGTAAVKTTKNYTVSFPTLTMSDPLISPSTLSAGGNASVTVSILNGATPYSQPVSVAFSSPCVVAGKATIGTPVITQNGVATASYTDKGCSNSDTITATAAVPSATLTKSGTITIQANAANSLVFVGVSNTNIALRGTGGPGRSETSLITFKVLDRSGNPVVGKVVNFAFSDTGTTKTTGDLSLFPSSGTSASDGTVSTSAYGGTIPTSIRVTASTAGDLPIITTISSVLVVSSGVPDQAHMSVTLGFGNCEGYNINQLCSVATAILGDHFGNQVPDGTVVSFTASGGVIEDSCRTAKGTCSVNFYAANPRTGDGKVTILAYAIGEESFVDSNGNNTYQVGEPFEDLSPDIFRDDDGNGAWSAGEPCLNPNGVVATVSGCNTSGNGIYDGVLRVPQTPTPSNPQALYIKRSFVAQFSTGGAIITVTPVVAPLTCTAGATAQALVKVTDEHGLWMPYQTQISFSALFGATGVTTDPSGTTVPKVVLAPGAPLTIPTYVVDIPCPTPDVPGTFIVRVTSPSGIETVSKTPIL